eukprot:Phypoly_transcript_27334.p1 GENE.Phypoly_transcript_27334~~Phypoly_transcript_27334.p1  ORF type:complete len:116 (-),score=8.56 Phypoly_transcript_27334:36-383(-)
MHKSFIYIRKLHKLKNKKRCGMYWLCKKNDTQHELTQKKPALTVATHINFVLLGVKGICTFIHNHNDTLTKVIVVIMTETHRKSCHDTLQIHHNCILIHHKLLHILGTDGPVAIQ